MVTMLSLLTVELYWSVYFSAESRRDWRCKWHSAPVILCQRFRQ